MNASGLPRKAWGLVKVEGKFMTFNAVLNVVLGSTFVPRPLRMLGLRAMGVRTRTYDIYPGVHLYLARAELLTIGRRSFVNHGVLIEATAPVTIGDDVMIAHEAAILTSHHRRLDDGSLERAATPLPVTIGDNAWVGARAVLLPGVTVGPRVVIAAGAVVAADCLEPGATYGGVPARRIS